MTLDEARTIAAVRGWLMTQSPVAVIGYCNSTRSCVLATCYGALTGMAVQVCSMEIVADGVPYPTLPWEMAFIAMHDRIRMGPAVVPVTALAILDRIEALSKEDAA